MGYKLRPICDEIYHLRLSFVPGQIFGATGTGIDQLNSSEQGSKMRKSTFLLTKPGVKLSDFHSTLQANSLVSIFRALMGQFAKYIYRILYR